MSACVHTSMYSCTCIHMRLWLCVRVCACAHVHACMYRDGHTRVFLGARPHRPGNIAAHMHERATCTRSAAQRRERTANSAQRHSAAQHTRARTHSTPRMHVYMYARMLTRARTKALARAHTHVYSTGPHGFGRSDSPSTLALHGLHPARLLCASMVPNTFRPFWQSLTPVRLMSYGQLVLVCVQYDDNSYVIIHMSYPHVVFCMSGRL